MNVSATSLSKLISTRKEELARLLEWRGTNFPVVERQNDLRISFIELELEDLEKLNAQPQLNENQQIVLEWLKGIAVKTDSAPIVTFADFGWQHFGSALPSTVEQAYQSMNGKQDLVIMSAYVNWALEQEEE